MQPARLKRALDFSDIASGPSVRGRQPDKPHGSRVVSELGQQFCTFKPVAGFIYSFVQILLASLAGRLTHLCKFSLPHYISEANCPFVQILRDSLTDPSLVAFYMLMSSFPDFYCTRRRRSEQLSLCTISE